MKIEIALVEHEGQLWFESGGVKFDTLNAIDFERCKELHVVRGGEIVGKTLIESARGDTVFSSGDGFRLQGSTLAAEDFSLDESLQINVPEGFDLVSNLRSYSGFLDTLLSTVLVGETLSLPELRERMAPKLGSALEATAAAQVLRFRRREHS